MTIISYLEDLMGLFEYEGVTRKRARYFEYQFAHGDQGAILTVRANGRSGEAEQIISRNGGDIGANAATFKYPAPSAAAPERRKIQQGTMRVCRLTTTPA